MFSPLLFQYLPSLAQLSLDLTKTVVFCAFSLLMIGLELGIEGLKELKCFLNSFKLKRDHVGETVPLLALEAALCGCDAGDLLCYCIHHVMKR